MGGGFGKFWPGGGVVLSPRGWGGAHRGGVKSFDLQGGGMRGGNCFSAAFGGHFLMFPPKTHVFLIFS